MAALGEQLGRARVEQNAETASKTFWLHVSFMCWEAAEAGSAEVHLINYEEMKLLCRRTQQVQADQERTETVATPP